jgi:hypothetical protein
MLSAHLLLAAILVLTIDAASVDRSIPYEKQEDIPDVNDPKIRPVLTCSACRAFAKEFYSAVQRVHTLRHGAPKSFELLDAVDRICKTIGEKWGLLLKNNKPTHEFSDNEAITRYKGSWIAHFLEDRCGQIMDTYDEELFRAAAAAPSLKDFKRKLCKEWEKNCKSRSEAEYEDL